MEYNLQAFYYQRRYIAKTIKSTQREYYINEITENRKNFKAVFEITNTSLQKQAVVTNNPITMRSGKWIQWILHWQNQQK